jgi:hypothetical protein
MAQAKEKDLYNNTVKGPKTNIEAANKHIKEILVKKKKQPKLAGYYNLEMVMEHMNITLLYLNMSDASVDILKLRNSSLLESAKKEFYKVLPLLEEIVGTDIDRPLVENKEFLIKIEKVNIRQILQLSQKILYVFDTLIEKMGENNKFKWSFVDLYVRIATVIKNLVNFTDIEKFRDMRNPFFRDRTELIKLCKVTLEEAAKQARQKYEMTSLAPGEIKKAIDLVSALRKVNVLFGEIDEAQKNKTLVDALRARLEEEEKKREKSLKGK